MPIHRVALIGLAILASTVTACGSSTPAAATGSAGPSAPSSQVPAASPSMAPSPPPTPAPSAAVFRVTGLTLDADPADRIGACPILITFTAKVTVEGGTGTVSYRWLSSDGDTSPTKTVDVREGHPMFVSSTWTVDPERVPTHAGWSSIELVGPHTTTPGSAESAKADFVFTCDTDDDVETIGFGIGGSDADCSIETPKRTFAPSDPIRMVATWRPSLVKGTTVTARLTRDGELVDGYPVTTTFDESTKCVHGRVWNDALPVGHYRLDVAPDTARAIGAEFDVK